MVVDVERFGDPSRTNLDQLAIRGGLYDALRQVFRQSRVDWEVTDPLIDLRTAVRRAVAPYLASLPIGVAFFGATTATTTFMAAPQHVAGYGLMSPPWPTWGW
jgi:hypothetical protein